MKTKHLLLTLAGIFTLSLTQSSSNDCDSFYPMDKGMSWTYQEFDKKGKLSNTNTTLVENVVFGDNSTTYTIKSTSVDPKPKKDEQPYENSLKYVCKDGVLSFDMNSYIAPESQESYANLDIEIVQSEMTIPSKLVTGQKLNDASIQVIMGGGGLKLMDINIVNRTVEVIEDVTTDAGTFNCAKITYDLNSKIGFMKMSSSSIEWYSSEVGRVKSESYDKNGKLMSSSVLTAFSK